MAEQEREPVFFDGRPGGLTGRLAQLALDCKRTLASNPRQPKALLVMGLVALASRQYEAAVKMVQAAVDVAPEMVTAWVALGQTLKAAGRSAEAQQAYGEAIRLDETNPLARIGLGELHVRS